ncbi:MAG TPA: HGGxSTG domain-containing protein [Hyphomicrobiaceae bacterium]|nr:HGGxSTG domain-containing protein [Hyphomicrobiaceae bacterium]
MRRAHTVTRCGARSKRTGKPCRGPAIANGRCRVHGRKSTGQAALRHGFYTLEAKAARRNARAALVGLPAALASVKRSPPCGMRATATRHG